MNVTKNGHCPLFAFLCLALCPAPAFSQNYIDLLRVEYSHSPNNQFKSGEDNTDIQEWVVDINTPIVLSENHALLTGFLFDNTRLAIYPDNADISVSTLNLKLGLNSRYSKSWSASYLLFPKFSSDLKNYLSDDFQFGIAALFKYTRNEHLNFRFGAFYNTDLFGPFVSPLFGVYFLKKKWEFNILLPSMVDINYRLDQSVRLGLRFNGSIKSFNLNSTFNGMDQYLAKTNNEIGAYIGWALGRVHLIGTVGHAVGRNYRSYAQGDQLGLAISLIKLNDERRQLNTDIKDGWVFKLTALYRLTLKDK